ncbi:MAG: hypothetical protein HQ507_02720 [Candidatus Marinimicrobia bacterium]|nr:hypothetical protein [Candidatus Neomarinimicrobiota bacterium]
MTVLWSCSFFGDRKKGQYIPVQYDLSQEIGPFSGLGANVPISFYSRRMKVLQTFNDLGIQYIRVKRTTDNWNDLLALRSATTRLGIKWIYTLDAIPNSFVNEYGQLVDVPGFAKWWAEEVDELLYQDVPADFIELLDRPDIATSDSLALTSEQYNELIHATRQELDLRDFQQVAIIGPALSGPGIAGEMETWYVELDQQAFDIINRWTVHMWEDRIENGKLFPALANLLEYLDQTESRKPVFVNSYASSETKFGMVEYPDPDQYDILGNLSSFETYYYSASFTMPYGLRVYSNTLDLLRNKEVVPFIYQLYDAPADVKYLKKSWGLLDLNGEPKPVFTLLSLLLKKIPENAVVVEANSSLQNGLNTLVFKSQDQIIFTLSNEENESQSMQVSLAGAGRSLEITTAFQCYATAVYPPELGKSDGVEVNEVEIKVRYDGASKSHVFPVSLEPHSIFVAEFSYK